MHQGFHLPLPVHRELETKDQSLVIIIQPVLLFHDWHNLTTKKIPTMFIFGSFYYKYNKHNFSIFQISKPHSDISHIFHCIHYTYTPSLQENHAVWPLFDKKKKKNGTLNGISKSCPQYRGEQNIFIIYSSLYINILF